MQWLEALNIHLRLIRERRGRNTYVTCATVETTPIPRGALITEYPGWLVEERLTPRGNIALHLFPSAS